MKPSDFEMYVHHLSSGYCNLLRLGDKGDKKLIEALSERQLVQTEELPCLHYNSIVPEPIFKGSFLQKPHVFFDFFSCINIW